MSPSTPITKPGIYAIYSNGYKKHIISGDHHHWLRMARNFQDQYPGRGKLPIYFLIVKAK